MARDVEHFFMHLFVTCTSFFENCLFNSFEHLLLGLVVILVFNFFKLFVYSGC
jgi:hypothetical protein